jgi:His/Glu/Gln/Arg/opine family amino acid ABC transporter permease subunit
MRELIENYWLYFLVGQYPNGPLGGLTLTVLLGSAAMLLAFPVGLVLGLARVSMSAWLRRPVAVLIYVVRGTPLLMVVFWAYFFLPSITGQKTDQFTTMLVALTVFNGAYIADGVREVVGDEHHSRYAEGGAAAGVAQHAAVSGESICQHAQGNILGLHHRADRSVLYRKPDQRAGSNAITTSLWRTGRRLFHTLLRPLAHRSRPGDSLGD